ncbi:MAG TPA: hypothetical protein EYP71_07135 [Dehalococcoidia bacterium]|nr:hypothetical protein [Dehalococcoidia bacterium]
MKDKDYYEELCKFYEIALGDIPHRGDFKEALRRTVAIEDLKVFFLLPLTGSITLTKLKKKAKMPADELEKVLTRLASEGFIMTYRTERDYAYERGNPVFMAEQQVRKKKETPQRALFAKFFNALIEGKTPGGLPTKTPYYRVLPAEPAVVEASALRTVDVNAVIPDARGVLPVDVITEMVRKDGDLIGVGECFCRKTKQVLGEGCGHPVETCFVFNEMAQTLIEHGFARKIDYDEAVQILRNCEDRGLVHNVDNCEGQIQSLCNCCSCCCLLLKSASRGETYAEAPSRYVVDFDPERCRGCQVCISRCPLGLRSVVEGKVVVNEERCIGCGLCAATCPSGASKMVPRKKVEKIPRSHGELYDRLGREALVSFARKKISQKLTGVIAKRS